MWVVHPLSMAASLCLKFILGGKTILEWQTYTVDLKNDSLLILLKLFLVLISLCRHLSCILYRYHLWYPFFCGILDVPSIVLGALEAGVRSFVPVGVTVVDDRTIPWSGRTTPGSLSVCPTPGSVLASPFIR